MTDRRQIADELWAAFKDRWTGERKYALRQITKHLTGRDDMSSWHYQIMQHIADDGEPYLAIHEYYTMHDGKHGWTAKPVPLEADSLPEMRMALLNVLRDLERHGVRDAKTGEPIQPAGSVDR
jgi:hypothetical protein